MQEQGPNRLPVRQIGGQPWEVLLPSSEWLACACEEDARVIANVPVLKHESLGQLRSGEQFAFELEQLADALGFYFTGNFGSRFFRRRAKEVRQRG